MITSTNYGTRWITTKKEITIKTVSPTLLKELLVRNPQNHSYETRQRALPRLSIFYISPDMSQPVINEFNFQGVTGCDRYKRLKSMKANKATGTCR